MMPVFNTTSFGNAAYWATKLEDDLYHVFIMNKELEAIHKHNLALQFQVSKIDATTIQHAKAKQILGCRLRAAAQTVSAIKDEQKKKTFLKGVDLPERKMDALCGIRVRAPNFIQYALDHAYLQGGHENCNRGKRHLTGMDILANNGADDFINFAFIETKGKVVQLHKCRSAIIDTRPTSAVGDTYKPSSS